MSTAKILGLSAFSVAMLGMAGANRASLGGSRTPDVLVQELRLDGNQSQRVASILSDFRESVRPIQEELRQVRNGLMRALREGREGGEIDALNRRQVVAYARLATAESAALAKIFALLNPDQKARATTMLARIGSILQIRPSPPQSTYRRPYASAEKRHVI